MGTNVACCTGIFNIFRLKTGVILWDDFGSGIVIFKQSQQNVSGSSATREKSQSLEKFTTIQ